VPECKVAIDSHRCSPRRGRRRSSGSGPCDVGGSPSSPASSPSDGGHGRRAAEAEHARERAGAAARPRRRAAVPKDLGSIEHGSAFLPLAGPGKYTRGLYACPFSPPSFHGSSQQRVLLALKSTVPDCTLGQRVAFLSPSACTLRSRHGTSPGKRSHRERAGAVRPRRSLVPGGRRNARSSDQRTHSGRAPFPFPRGENSVGGAVRLLDLTRPRGPSRGAMWHGCSAASSAGAAPRLRNRPRDGSGGWSWTPGTSASVGGGERCTVLGDGRIRTRPPEPRGDELAAGFYWTRPQEIGTLGGPAGRMVPTGRF
jgi:hypothetical protein